MKKSPPLLKPEGCLPPEGDGRKSRLVARGYCLNGVGLEEASQTTAPKDDWKGYEEEDSQPKSDVNGFKLLLDIAKLFIVSFHIRF